MKILKVLSIILFFSMLSLGYAETVSPNSVLYGVPVNIPSPIKVVESQCLVSQICEPEKKIKTEPDEQAVTEYYGVITYQLRNSLAYIINDGNISRVQEVSIQNETQKSLGKEESAKIWCEEREKQIYYFYSKCKL